MGQEKSNQESKSSEFEPIPEKKEILKLFTEAARTLSATTVWTKDQKIFFQTEIARISEADQTLFFLKPKDADLSHLREKLPSGQTPECLFNLSHPRASLFFKRSLKGDKDAGLEFALPSQLFKVQRRESLRIYTRPGYVLKASFPDPLFPEQKHEKKVFDMSVTGLSFLSEEKDELLFPKDLILKDLKVKVLGKELTLDAQVKHVKKLVNNTNERLIRVGVQFLNVNRLAGETLTQYILDETRKRVSEVL